MDRQRRGLAWGPRAGRRRRGLNRAPLGVGAGALRLGGDIQADGSRQGTLVKVPASA
jgi:hypothetical protein